MLKKFFFKRFKTFFLVTLIPILILTIISSSFLYRSTKNSLVQKSSNNLALLNDNLSTVLSSCSYQYELLTYNPRLILSLEKLLSHDTFEYSDIVFINSLKTSLLSITESYSFIDSVYLYLDSYNNYYSSDTGFQKLAQTNDISWYNIYKEHTKKDSFWFEKREVHFYKTVPPQEYLTIFQRMSNKKGAIVVNINLSKLESLLRTASTDNMEIFLFDQKGNLLCQTDSYDSFIDFSAPLSSDTLQKFLAKTETQSQWQSLKNKLYLIQSIYNPNYGFIFVSVIPTQTFIQKLFPNLLLMLGVIIINCIIALLLSYIVTKRNFQQISTIIQTFDNAENGHLPSTQNTTINDEYDVILNNVITIFLNSSYLQHQLNEQEYKQKLAEMSALQLQINPHFLFNTLQALDFEALKITGGFTSVNTMIQNLSSILKYSIQDPLQPVVLKDELDYLKKYAQIQLQRFGDKFVIYFEIDDDMYDFPVFRLMLQPLVENSISHGIASLDKTGCIKVRSYRRNNYAYFHVIDNGIGMTKDKVVSLSEKINNKNSSNIGLTNVNRRLLLKYGKQSCIKIHSKKNMGTCISFVIPLSDI